MERLTPDLTIDILSRLPIRSLLRAKRVCKSWRTLTSDPILSTLHLNRSSFNDDAIFVSYPKNFGGQKQIYFSEQPSLLSKENISLFTKKIHLSFINDIRRIQVFVVGTCNGLLCLATTDKVRDFITKSIHILNPITGEHQQLPDFGITWGKFPKSVTYGFGFDDCKNVFKVVAFFSYGKNRVTHMDVDVNEMQIWTIGHNKWRRQLDNLPNVYSPQIYFNAFVDGFLHLIGAKGNDPDFRTIVLSFHLGSEDFEIIQTPDSIALKNCFRFTSSFTLGVIDNCLSFVDAANDGFVEIWLRKIENGIFSWIKTFSIHGEGIAPIVAGKLVFLKYSKDGELLLQFYNRLLSYNAKTNTSKIFEIRGQEQEEIYFTETFPFVGSLISIKSQD